ncbi:MAG: hypothetical protein ACOYN6_16375 [Ignavibacteria bacterium]
MGKSIFVFLLLIPFWGNTQKGYDLVGIWQDSPVVAAGWSDTYLFYSDGKFVFNYSQMVCDSRDVSYSGTWELRDEGKLNLTIKNKTMIVGGALVKASGSCASEYEIEGGEEKIIELTNQENISIILSDFTIDTENHSIGTMLFNGSRFWRMSNDPKNYY